MDNPGDDLKRLARLWVATEIFAAVAVGASFDGPRDTAIGRRFALEQAAALMRENEEMPL